MEVPQGEPLIVDAFFERAGMEVNPFGNYFADKYDRRVALDKKRVVAKYSAPLWQARLYPSHGIGCPLWTSPDFDDPISAFVYAQTENWGQ